jgi:NADPH-dependent 2,4-dienoyl-CoA reductase/sulfur reductase-like enzyme
VNDVELTYSMDSDIISMADMALQQPGQELLLDRILCQAQALDVAIAGGGPIGILTAIAIRKKLKRTIHIFEGSAPGRSSARVSAPVRRVSAIIL